MSGVSFIITTLNCDRTLANCLDSIKFQKFPRKLFEVLLLDGGSTDDTVKIAKTFRSKYRLPIKIVAAGWRNNQEARRRKGFELSKFDLVCILDADNYLEGSDWIKRLIEPLEENPDLVGSFTLHFAYDPNQTLFNRYISLFGNNDPVVFYLHKTDRLKWVDKSWPNKRQIVKESDRYTVLKFNKFDFPTLGSNGTILRKKLINIHRLQSRQFFHTDILYDLLERGHDIYAGVGTSLVHDTSSSLIAHIEKRFRYMYLHHLELWSHRRYKIFNPHYIDDWINLTVFILFTIMVFPLLIESVLGYLRKKDHAWFIHPIVCWMFLLSYSVAVVKKIWKF